MSCLRRVWSCVIDIDGLLLWIAGTWLVLYPESNKSIDVFRIPLESIKHGKKEADQKKGHNKEKTNQERKGKIKANHKKG